MISGAHVIIESRDPEADRAFFRDVLKFNSIDAGGGWLIFALPPGEVAVHPGANGRHQLYLMCDDLDKVLADLQGNKIPVNVSAEQPRWGRLATMVLPGGGELAVYQPRHERPQP